MTRGKDRALTVAAWIGVSLVVAAMVTVLVWATSPPANSHQPYGKCKEGWQAPQSEGAWHCRSHGWTIRRHFVLGPKDFVHFVDHQPCPTEDSDGPCFWNARVRGDGGGDSFIIHGERDGIHRIWWVRFGR